MSVLGTPAAISINVSFWWSKRGLRASAFLRSVGRPRGYYRDGSTAIAGVLQVKSDWLTQRSGCQSASCAGGQVYASLTRTPAMCVASCQSQAEIVPV